MLLRAVPAITARRASPDEYAAQGEPVRDLPDDSLRIRRWIYADIVAFEGCDRRLQPCHLIVQGELTGVVRGTRPLSREKAQVPRAV